PGWPCRWWGLAWWLMRTRSPTRRLASVVIDRAGGSRRTRSLMTAPRTPSLSSSSPRAIASTTTWTRSGGTATERDGGGLGGWGRRAMIGRVYPRSRRCRQRARCWRREPGAALEQLPEHDQRVQLLLAGGRDIAAKRQEPSRPGQGAPAPGD